jgi:hypothetical protein
VSRGLQLYWAALIVAIIAVLIGIVRGDIIVAP